MLFEKKILRDDFLKNTFKEYTLTKNISNRNTIKHGLRDDNIYF